MIHIVLDANQLYISYEKCNELDVYNHFLVNKNLNDLLKIRDHSNCIDDILVLVPEIVIQELIQQKYEQYIKDGILYNAVSMRLGVDSPLQLKTKDEFVCSSMNHATVYFSSMKIEILPLCNEDYFSDIVNCAINKVPPFEGKTGKADKGFKDTLLFYSLIQYASNHFGDYILLSNDKIFSNQDSAREIKNIFALESGCQLSLFQNIEDIRSSLVTQKADIKLESIAYSYCELSKSITEPVSRVPINIYQKRPVFTGDYPIIKILNNKIDALYDSDIGYWDGYNVQRYDDELDEPYESSLTTKITNNSNGLLSIVLYDYKYLGGAHGGTTISAYTFDISQGRQLSLTQLLKKDNNQLCDMINKCVNIDIATSQPGKYFDESVNISDANSVVYYLEDKMVHIVFNEYELGPYASGAIDLVICEDEF